MPSRSDTEYVGRGVGGFASFYVYVNAVDGQQFLSTTPPTAAQQASFAQRNPGAPLPTPEPPQASVDSAGAIQANAETARDENANTQNPPVPLASTAPVSSNASTTPVAATETVVAPPEKLPAGVPDAATPLPDTTPPVNLPTTPVPSTAQNLIADSGGSDASQSYIYRAISVTHMFSKGKFTQQLEGALVIYDIDPTNTGAPVQLGDYGLNLGGLAVSEEQQTAAESAAGAGPASSTSGYAATDPRSVSTPRAPAAPAENAGTTASDSATATAPVPETVAPADTAPPTSGGQTVAVAPAPAPPSGPVSVVMGSATITAEISSSTNGYFFSVTLPSNENYSAGSIAGVVAGAQNKLQDPGDGDFNSLTLIVASFAQVQGPALEAQLRAQNTAPAATAAASQNMAKEA